MSCASRRDPRRAGRPPPSRPRRPSPCARRASTKPVRHVRARARRPGVRNPSSPGPFSSRSAHVANGMTMYVAGEWRRAAREEEIRSPYDGEVVGVVPVADADDAELAITAAVEGARAMRALSAFERSEILSRAANAI